MKKTILWSSRNSGLDPKHMPLPKDIRHVVVHEGEKGKHAFLLGADIIPFRGKLFCGWGNSRKDENDKYSVMGGRMSSDGGIIWSAYLIIAGALKKKPCSHGVFYIRNKRLYAFVPSAQYDAANWKAGTGYPNLDTELFEYLENKNTWKHVGVAIRGKQFWPLARPLVLPNGQLLMAGLVCDQLSEQSQHGTPAVARCDGDDLTKWEVSAVPLVKRNDHWGEGGLIVEKNRISYLYRNGWKNTMCIQLSQSLDGGKTWTQGEDTNLPASPSKIACGTLSTGQRYVIFNATSNTPDRNTLAIAVSAPHKNTFNKSWRIQHGPSPEPRSKGLGKNPQWAYPSACEHDGSLYVVYASSKEDCILSIIPLSSLR